MSEEEKRNKNDLNNAGNVLGSQFNSNEYDPNYKEKKGTKGLFIGIIVVTVACAIFLIITSLLK